MAGNKSISGQFDPERETICAIWKGDDDAVSFMNERLDAGDKIEEFVGHLSIRTAINANRVGFISSLLDKNVDLDSLYEQRVPAWGEYEFFRGETPLAHALYVMNDSGVSPKIPTLLVEHDCDLGEKNFDAREAVFLARTGQAKLHGQIASDRWKSDFEPFYTLMNEKIQEKQKVQWAEWSDKAIAGKMDEAQAVMDREVPRLF